MPTDANGGRILPCTSMLCHLVTWPLIRHFVFLTLTMAGPTLTTPGASALDPSNFPHITDLIVRYAPVSALPSLRLTCRALSAAVERRLQVHLITTPHESSSALLHLWHRGWGYSPHTRTLDLYFEAPTPVREDGVSPEQAGSCTLPNLKHVRLISWLEDGSARCAPLVTRSVIVPLLHRCEDDINPIAPQTALDLVKFERFIIVYPPEPLDIELYQLHPGQRAPVEVVVVVPPTALAFDINSPLPFPVRVPVTFPNLPPRFGDLPLLAANSNFMTLACAAGALFDSGHRLTVVGILDWVFPLRDMLRLKDDNVSGTAAVSAGSEVALKQLMARYLETLGCASEKTEAILTGVKFPSEEEWRVQVGEEEYRLAVGAYAVRKAYLDSEHFSPWTAAAE